MASRPVIVWFRQDLRLEDNPALAHALSSGSPVVPVFLWAPGEEGEWAPGAASRAWLHRSLAALAAALEARGSRLVLRGGGALEQLRALVRETGAGAVVWNRRYEPDVIARDTAVKQALLGEGIEARSFNSTLLFAPQRVTNQAGGPFRVFTAFWRACQKLPVREPTAPVPPRFPAPAGWPRSERLEVFQLDPPIAWDAEFWSHWAPGETGAGEALARFVREGAGVYAQRRDQPAAPGTSRLSPHLHFGEISPVRVWHALEHLGGEGGVFRRELGWREFATHLLFHFPSTITQPLRPEFARLPTRTDAAVLRAWQRGRTGYPIVDAGMRELWRTGWMHNRVRMVVASFLVKHLQMRWQEGARWFWETLVDADLANNTLGWQWSAGCGADAAPYFRIFNPVLQGRKFDPQGEYVRRFVPELAGLADAFIHAPWEAPPETLRAAGVRLGETYPRPVVDHATARRQALAAFAALRDGA